MASFNKFVISGLEGVDYLSQNLKLLIIVHNSLDQEISPFCIQELLEIPIHGIVRLILQDAFSSSTLGSVSFSASSLSVTSGTWLPLTAQTDDFFDNFFQSYSMKIQLTPVANELPSICEEAEWLESDNNSLIQYSSILNDNQSYLENHVKKLQAQLEESMKESRSMEERLINELTEKDKVILKLRSENCALVEDNRKLRVVEKNLRDDLLVAKNKIAEIAIKHKNSPVFRTQTPTTTRPTVKESPRHLRKDHSVKSFGRKSKENLEKEISKNINRHNLKGVLKKKEGNVYLYGNNVVTFDMKKDKLICKVAGGFKTFDDFVETSLMKFIEKRKDNTQISSLGKDSRLNYNRRSSPCLANLSLKGHKD